MALVPVYLRVLYIIYRTQNTRQRQNRVGYKTINNKQLLRQPKNVVKVTRSVFAVLYVRFFLFIAECLSVRLLILQCVFSVGGGGGGGWCHASGICEQSRSAFQSSNPIGQFIIHIYICIHAVALTTP